MELLKDIVVGAIFFGTLLVGLVLCWAIFTVLRYVIERRSRAHKISF
jgi:uncharacterized membrane protein